MPDARSGEQVAPRAERHFAGRSTQRPALALMVLILLAAAAFRFVGLDNFPTPHGATPPGLAHDEVSHWLIKDRRSVA